MIFVHSGSRAFCQESAENTHYASPNMVVASNGALRGAEGELHIYLGEAMQTLTPFAWHSPAAGVIECSTEVKKCRYEFSFHQIVHKDGSSPMKAGVLDATAVHAGEGERPTVLWMGWRNDYSFTQRPVGFSLGREKTEEAPLVVDIKWNPACLLYFQEGDFICDNRIVYLTANHKDWMRETWVRQVGIPYRDLTRQSVIGITRFERVLKPNESAGLRVIVPYTSISSERRQEFLSFILPVE
ncbi:MAG: hypothetical protein JXR73_12790 [Candidatus Omnitrophica bacterium]|nr:hypothetical protein [Candidatus Omnitrophota bacterium]